MLSANKATGMANCDQCGGIHDTAKSHTQKQRI